MSQESVSRVALLPIQPRYVDAILAGQKRVEFRRRRFGRSLDHVVIYATHPIQRIVAFFEVSEVTEAPPAELWSRFEHVGGIEEEKFQAYFMGVSKGIAIGIERVVALERPLALEGLSTSFSPPQSFAYLSEHHFSRVRSEVRIERDQAS